MMADAPASGTKVTIKRNRRVTGVVVGDPKPGTSLVEIKMDAGGPNRFFYVSDLNAVA